MYIYVVIKNNYYNLQHYYLSLQFINFGSQCPDTLMNIRIFVVNNIMNIVSEAIE